MADRLPEPHSPQTMEEFRYRLRQLAEEKGSFAPGTPGDESREFLRASNKRLSVKKPSWLEEVQAQEDLDFEKWADTAGKPKPTQPGTYWDDYADFMDKMPEHLPPRVNEALNRAKTIGSELANFGGPFKRLAASSGGKLALKALGPIGVAADVYGIGQAGWEYKKLLDDQSKMMSEQEYSREKYGDIKKATATRHLRARAKMPGGVPDRVLNELTRYGPWDTNRISANQATYLGEPVENKNRVRNF